MTPLHLKLSCRSVHLPFILFICLSDSVSLFLNFKKMMGTLFIFFFFWSEMHVFFYYFFSIELPPFLEKNTPHCLPVLTSPCCPPWWRGGSLCLPPGQAQHCAASTSAPPRIAGSWGSMLPPQSPAQMPRSGLHSAVGEDTCWCPDLHISYCIHGYLSFSSLDRVKEKFINDNERTVGWERRKQKQNERGWRWKENKHWWKCEKMNCWVKVTKDISLAYQIPQDRQQ